MEMSTGMEQNQSGAYMNRWYENSESASTGLHQDYYNSMAQAMHCAYGNNVAGMNKLPNFFFILNSTKI